MSEYLNCNIHKCKAALNGRAWVTRCMHIFCSEHGSAFFHNNKTEISCPICNEVNIREKDTLLCQTNPSDMVLAGLRPEKVIRLVEKSFKLWKCQMEAERRHDSTRIQLLTKQANENSLQFKHELLRKEANWKTEFKTMRGNYDDITNKLRQVTQELEAAHSSLRKYKAMHESMADRPILAHQLRSPAPRLPTMSPAFTRDSLMDDYSLPGLNPINNYFNQH